MQNILNKLAKVKKAQPKRVLSKKANTRKVAVKLSLINEIENLEDRFETAYSEASYLAYEYGDDLISKIDDYRMEIGQLDDYIVNGNTRDLEEVAGTILTLLESLEEKATDLGLPPDDLLYNYFELKEQVESASDVIIDSEKKYKEVVDYSGVLGNFWN